MSVDRHPRSIHIVESLHRGAVEHWLVRMLRHARARGTALDWTFYCALPHRGDLEDEAIALGARVIHSPVPIGRRLQFIRALRRELKDGHYKVLHCHHDLVSAIYLIAALGVPLRRTLVHVHNADLGTLTNHPLKRFAYRKLGRAICLLLSDRIVGISSHALDTFLRRPRREGVDVVHYYGVDPGPHRRELPSRSSFRRRLDLPEDALVLLFAGRLVPEKNPVFAVDVLAELRRLDPRIVGVFAGAGALEDAVISRVKEHRLDSAVRMVGWQADVAAAMAASDWFILPRPDGPNDAREGFGIAVVEAQLAGLRLLLSEAIGLDPLLPTASYRRLPIAAGPGAWAVAALDLLGCPAPSTEAALDAFVQSPMDLDRALDGLLCLHS